MGACAAGLEISAGSGRAAEVRPAGAAVLATLEAPRAPLPPAGLCTRGEGLGSEEVVTVGAAAVGAADGTGRGCCLLGPAGDAKGEVGLKGCCGDPGLSASLV